MERIDLLEFLAETKTDLESDLVKELSFTLKLDNGKKCSFLLIKPLDKEVINILIKHL
jgi:hypothetical protein